MKPGDNKNNKSNTLQNLRSNEQELILAEAQAKAAWEDAVSHFNREMRQKEEMLESLIEKTNQMSQDVDSRWAGDNKSNKKTSHVEKHQKKSSINISSFISEIINQVKEAIVSMATMLDWSKKPQQTHKAPKTKNNDKSHSQQHNNRSAHQPKGQGIINDIQRGAVKWMDKAEDVMMDAVQATSDGIDYAEKKTKAALGIKEPNYVDKVKSTLGIKQTTGEKVKKFVKAPIEKTKDYIADKAVSDIAAGKISTTTKIVGVIIMGVKDIGDSLKGVVQNTKNRISSKSQQR